MKVFVIVFTLTSPLGDIRVAAVDRPGPFHKTETACEQTLEALSKKLPTNTRGAKCVEIVK